MAENFVQDGHVVKLHIYDLSQGLARQLSTSFLGKALEAIWHTGVVVYGNEYYFGGGILQDPAGRTPYGTPIRVIELGTTHVPKEVFEDYLHEMSPRYTAATYNLLSHNCNNFSNEVAQFLVGTTIPNYILELPNEIMNSPMASLILPMIQGLETTLTSGAVPQVPQFRMPFPTVQPAHNNDGLSSSGTVAETISGQRDSSDSHNKATNNVTTVPPAVHPATAPEAKTAKAPDSLGEARKVVQEEIKREFAAIMATGTLRASEAAALATKRVMERHGREVAPAKTG